MEYDVFSRPELMHIPTKRAAWSDRTALFMAEMSKLAYSKFEQIPNENPGEKDDEKEKHSQEVLDRMLEKLLAPGTGGPDDEDPEPTKGLRDLVNILAKASFTLVRVFVDKKTDTQAFLAMSAPGGGSPFGNEEVAVLAFRGTQSVRNWLTNIDAIQKDTGGAVVHEGFLRAFDSVKPEIERSLAPLIDQRRTLYLTGHSLGGALALIATRDLARDSHGACYTFGSPRVARFGFAEFIKTPIYRVVNSNDLVPRIPPAYLPTILRFVLRFLNFPAVGLLRGLLKKVSNYVHQGDMRFLKRSKAPDYLDLQVLSNPSVIYRFIWYWPALLANIKSPIENHSIDIYCAKLAAYATRRNDHRFNG